MWHDFNRLIGTFVFDILRIREACLGIRETGLEQKIFNKYEDPDFKHLYQTQSPWNVGGNFDPFRT